MLRMKSSRILCVLGGGKSCIRSSSYSYCVLTISNELSPHETDFISMVLSPIRPNVWAAAAAL